MIDKEIIYLIKSQTSGGSTLISDDYPFTDEEIFFRCNAVRALFLKRSLDKKEFISDTITQFLECVDVIPVDSSTCYGLTTGCTLYRTVERIPKLLEGVTKETIKSIQTVDLEHEGIGILDYKRVMVKINFPYRTIKKPIAFISDGYIYIWGYYPKLLTKIRIEGVFDNPKEVYDFNNSGETPCGNIDYNYPLPMHLVTDMVNIVCKQILESFIGTKDRTNNAEYKAEQDNPQRG